MSENLKRKLTSRKFWIAVAGLVSGIVMFFSDNEQLGNRVAGVFVMVADIMAYIWNETSIDIERIKGEEKNG